MPESSDDDYGVGAGIFYDIKLKVVIFEQSSDMISLWSSFCLFFWEKTTGEQFQKQDNLIWGSSITRQMFSNESGGKNSDFG